MFEWLLSNFLDCFSSFTSEVVENSYSFVLGFGLKPEGKTFGARQFSVSTELVSPLLFFQNSMVLNPFLAPWFYLGKSPS